jgi:hypothetical protein
MKVSRFTRVVFIFLTAFLYTDQFMTSVAIVPPGACLYPLDPPADRALRIVGAPPAYTACGGVMESSASDGFEMGELDTLSMTFSPIDTINHQTSLCG